MVTTRDLAILYECANGTKTINQSVSLHLDRFPKDFYFQLTKEEYDNLKFQFETSSLNEYVKEEYCNLKSQIGTSKFNSHGGARTFSINKLEDKEVCAALKNKVDKI